MAIQGPKFQFAVAEPPFDLQYDAKGQIVGILMRPNLAAFLASAQQTLFNSTRSGTTTTRPTSTMPGRWIGMPYFDTTLGYPIWWDGTQWVDATGTPA